MAAATATLPSAVPKSEDKWVALAKEYVMGGNPVTWPAMRMVKIANGMKPFSTATAIHDNGCGPGPVTMALLNTFGTTIPESAMLRATDFSPAMLEQLKNLRAIKVDAGDKVWQRLQTDIIDAHTLEGFEESSFSHQLAGFVYMLLPDPQKALRATWKILQDDGLLIMSCWKGAQWMDVMLAPEEIEIGDYKALLSSSWSTPEGVMAQLESAGFKEVGAETVDTSMSRDTHENLATFLLNIPIVQDAVKNFSDEEKAKVRQKMLEKSKECCPEEPVVLDGVAIIAWGKK